MATERDRDELLYFNGIDGATGDYGLPPMTGEELTRLVEGAAPAENLDELRHRHRQRDARHFGVKEGVDPGKLDEAGWGVIFAQDADPAVRDALAPLLELRREQAGERYRVYAGADGYRPGESKAGFLARHGVGPGPADPDKVPYYLLVVGSPQAVPFRFQTQLDVQYAVGRIHFEDVEAYARYAESVVAAETGRVRLPRRVSFFGVENAGDRATSLSTRHLVMPLFESLREGRPDWEVEARVRAEATKAGLARLLGGEETPALLFTASHGLEFPNGDPRQLAHQGALLCGDWPGPDGWRGPLPQDFYLAGDDLAADAGLQGLISFHFACYGAGTPLHDEFAKIASKDRAPLAPHAFLAALPARLLSHPRGGALAVVGHVERAWGYSFVWPGAGAQTTVFESTLARLLDGHPVGSAVEYLNERYAELSTLLADQLEEIEYRARTDPYELAGIWTANNDARGYLILGDPAVRLVAAEPGRAAGSRAIPDESGAEPPVEIARPTDRSVQPPPSPDEDLSFTPPSAAAKASDVRFSAYHPRALPVGERRPLVVYAHIAGALAAIAADARQVLGKAAEGYRQARAAASRAIVPGTEITLVPAGEGLVFDPPLARLVWSGAWQRAEFEMAASGERVGHVIEGTIACYVGPLLIADVRLPVVVPRPGEDVAETEPGQQVQTAEVYQSIFASYSHDDTAIVKAMETAYEALGNDYLRDVVKLKAGQRWSDELLEMIERADVFQLFWSEKASRSPYVEQEWRHALGLAGRKPPAFIRPIYWQEPLARPPADLAQIHFAFVDLSALTGVPAVPVVAAASDLGPLLSRLDESLTTLTISTYAAADPADPETARLKARTHVSLTGDVRVYLSDSEADRPYLDVHGKTVDTAVRARVALLQWLGGKWRS